MVGISLLGISAALLAIQFKNIKAEYSIYLSITACIIIFFYIITKLSVIIDLINKFVDESSIHPTYIFTLIKIMGITYIAEFSSDICKDCGYQAMANQLQIFGKLSVLVLSIPIIETLINSIGAIF